MQSPIRIAVMIASSFLPAIASVSAADQPADPSVQVLDIEPVWSGHSVRFALLTHGDKQFVAYYDANRQLSVAERSLGSKDWKITKLDSHVEWDSHNYLTMTVDREGYLHLSGNMHVVPLVYFRSEKPLDASSLQPVHRMTGDREDRTTYPVFYDGPSGELIFAYRDGSSGEGDTLFNIYDESTKTWKRLYDTPMFDGEGKMNAYPVGPEKGPDGYYHVTWVWRDTVMAETNHDLSYMRSRDLKNWETIDGKPVPLPVTPANTDVIIDPIPVHGGILNGSGKIGFDLENRLVIAYHKFDEGGKTQLYFARPSPDGWQINKASQWEHRWEIQGGGSLDAEIIHSAVSTQDGKLVIAIRHVKEGSGQWEIDPDSLTLKGKFTPAEPAFVMPQDLRKPASRFPGIKVQTITDSGRSDDGFVYRLRWESLRSNRDRPRPKPWPEPTMLRLVGWKSQVPALP